MVPYNYFVICVRFHWPALWHSCSRAKIWQGGRIRDDSRLSEWDYSPSHNELLWLSWLYTYRFSRFDMFVHYFVNYFVRLLTNHYTLATISPILFIFDSVRNLMRNFPYLLFDILWKYRLSGENGKTRDEKNDWRDGLQNAIYTLIVSLILPTFFRVLINLTISV